MKVYALNVRLRKQLPGIVSSQAAFSLASTGQVGALLSGAGFGGIEFAKADEPMLIGRDVDDVLDYERTCPSARQVLTGLSPAQADELTRRVRAAAGDESGSPPPSVLCPAEMSAQTTGRRQP